MSGIAEVLLNMGYQVSGSDLKESPITRRLQRLGARVYYGHDPENLGDAQVVVYSSAVREVNPELMAAQERMIPIVPRGEMLAELMRMKYGIAVAGSHGKTTTTSLIASILSHAGLDPTAVIGGKVHAFGSNAKVGKGEVWVCEADESDGSFLKLSPVIAVVTNIDPEHLDHYHSLDELKAAFRQFLEKVPFYGLVVACWDHSGVREVLKGFSRRLVTYGLSQEARFRAEGIKTTFFQTSFNLYHQGENLGRLKLDMPGRHNVLNCLSAIAVAWELEVSFQVIREAVEEFEGVERRFQLKGEVGGITFIDDYGHHPEEIKATLRAVREGHQGRIVVLFQPHRYTRTQILFDYFLEAFSDADLLIMTEIYPAGEDPIAGVTALKLAQEIGRLGRPQVIYLPDREQMLDEAVNLLQPGDLVITLGAGDIWTVGEAILERLKG